MLLWQYHSKIPILLVTHVLFYSPAWKYSEDFPSTSVSRHRAHTRSVTAPMSLSHSYRPSSPSRSLSYALDDLDISTNSWKNFSDPVLRFKSRNSPNLKAALGASDRIQQRVERVIEGKSPRKFVSFPFNMELTTLTMWRFSVFPSNCKQNLKEQKTNKQTSVMCSNNFPEIRHGLILLWFKDLINVTKKIQFFFHWISCCND